MKTLLEVTNLQTSFFTHLGEIQAVRGASFKLEEGKVLGIVGESGSGKSVTSLSIMGPDSGPGRDQGRQQHQLPRNRAHQTERQTDDGNQG